MQNDDNNNNGGRKPYKRYKAGRAPASSSSTELRLARPALYRL